MRNIAIVLSGCGFKDGSEITEAISILIALSNAGVNYKMFGASTNFHSVNYLSGATLAKNDEGSRNTLVEAARIARGKIQDLSELGSSDLITELVELA